MREKAFLLEKTRITKSPLHTSPAFKSPQHYCLTCMSLPLTLKEMRAGGRESGTVQLRRRVSPTVYESCIPTICGAPGISAGGEASTH